MFIHSSKGSLSFHYKAVDATHSPLLCGIHRWPDRRRICFICSYPLVVHFLEGGARHP